MVQDQISEISSDLIISLLQKLGSEVAETNRQTNKQKHQHTGKQKDPFLSQDVAIVTD